MEKIEHNLWCCETLHQRQQLHNNGKCPLFFIETCWRIINDNIIFQTGDHFACEGHILGIFVPSDTHQTPIGKIILNKIEDNFSLSLPIPSQTIEEGSQQIKRGLAALFFKDSWLVDSPCSNKLGRQSCNLFKCTFCFIKQLKEALGELSNGFRLYSSPRNGTAFQPSNAIGSCPTLNSLSIIIKSVAFCHNTAF